MNSFRVYKANKQSKGTASEWQLSYRHGEKYQPWKLFFSIATQIGVDENGNARFDWEKAICVRMGISDLCEILAVLEGRQESAGHEGKLYHATENDSKVINFFRNEGSGSYCIKVSHKSQRGLVALQQGLSVGEGCALRVLIESAIPKLVNWGVRGSQRKFERVPDTVPMNEEKVLEQAI